MYFILSSAQPPTALTSCMGREWIMRERIAPSRLGRLNRRFLSWMVFRNACRKKCCRTTRMMTETNAFDQPVTPSRTHCAAADKQHKQACLLKRVERAQIDRRQPCYCDRADCQEKTINERHMELRIGRVDDSRKHQGGLASARDPE